MDKFLINGPCKIKGKVFISGSKNASLPILAATLLFDKPVIIKNLPRVRDINTMLSLLKSLGSKIILSKDRKTAKIINKKKMKTYASYSLVKTMRGSILALGPLISKFNKAKISLPGGCLIGARPVNYHLTALKKLGMKYKIKDGYILAKSNGRLKGQTIKFPKISVGATENSILAACLAKGKTVLKNCAIEPEVQDLIKFLNNLGGNIKIKGRKIFITGCKKIKKTVFHKVIFDRIELGTYMIAAALIGKKILLNKVNPELVLTEINTLKKMGVKLKIKKDTIEILKSKNLKKINVSTKPYPGFPTDLQAQLMVLMTRASGKSVIKENIFENRFMHVPELKRMGANIITRNKIATIFGPSKLTGAEVMATDLRASVSLVLAGLVADNRTIINRIYHLDRGYESLEKKLKNCKARVKRI